MTLRPDLVLVALPPRVEHTSPAGLALLPEDAPAQAGIVRVVGRAVRDVAPGDRVVFGTLVGEAVDVNGRPHVLLREVDLDAVLERTA